MFSYLHGHQDLVLLWAEVVALCEENFPEGTFSKLPLQNNVVSLDVLNNCKAKTGHSTESMRCATWHWPFPSRLFYVIPWRGYSVCTFGGHSRIPPTAPL